MRMKIEKNPISDVDFVALTQTILQQAQAKGASAVEVATNISTGYSATVRLGAVDTIEYNQDKGVTITVYFQQHKGVASTSDTSMDAITTSLEAACNIAKYTNEDPCMGLADADLMAYDYPV